MDNKTSHRFHDFNNFRIIRLGYKLLNATIMYKNYNNKNSALIINIFRNVPGLP